jgi:hypothetical protein
MVEGKRCVFLAVGYASMQKIIFLVLVAVFAIVLVFTFLFVPPVGREIIVQSVAAHGGEDRLERAQIGKIKGTGVKVADHDLFFSIQWEETFDQPNRLKRVIHKSILGHTTTASFLYRDGKSWVQIDNQEPVIADTGVGFNESIACPLGLLLNIYRNKPTVKLLNETKVGDRPAVGVSVEYENGAPVDLYFDKENFLLLQMRTNTSEPGGPPVRRDRVFSDYQLVSGVRIPGKVHLYVNTKLTDELVVTDASFFPRLDPAVFDRP